MARILAYFLMMQIAAVGVASAQTSGGGTSSGGPGAATGGSLGSSAGAPGTNSAGTALPSGSGVNVKGAGAGRGDPLLDPRDKAVDRKIKSICRGC